MSTLNSKIRVDGADKLIGQLENMKAKVQKKALRKIVNGATGEILKVAKARVRRKSGALAKSLGRRVRIKKTKMVAVIGRVYPRKGFDVTDANGNVHKPEKIAHIIEYGRGPIEVKEKKVLADGSTIFGKKVAAVPAHPFMRPALDAGNQITEKAANDAIAATLTENPNVV